MYYEARNASHFSHTKNSNGSALLSDRYQGARAALMFSA